MVWNIGLELISVCKMQDQRIIDIIFDTHYAMDTAKHGQLKLYGSIGIIENRCKN